MHRRALASLEMDSNFIATHDINFHPTTRRVVAMMGRKPRLLIRPDGYIRKFTLLIEKPSYNATFYNSEENINTTNSWGPLLVGQGGHCPPKLKTIL